MIKYFLVYTADLGSFVGLRGFSGSDYTIVGPFNSAEQAKKALTELSEIEQYFSHFKKVDFNKQGQD